MRQIDLNIQGSRVSVGPGDPCVAGEGNASCLALRFGPDWDGLAKTAQFWDAHGQNPVTCLIGEDMGEQEEGGRVYRLPIPPEPLAQAGTCTLVLEGTKDAVRMRTLPVELEVQDAPWSVQAQPPTDPTPTLAQQLQSQIDALAGRDSGNFANALVGVQQGAAVRVDDVSPLAREVSVAVTGQAQAEGAQVLAFGKNLWHLDEGKGLHSYLQYDPDGQIWTATSGGIMWSAFTFPTALPVGTQVAVTLKILSGQVASGSGVAVGGYHYGTTNSWQGYVYSTDRGVDLTGKVYTAAFTATDTVTDLLIFVDGAVKLAEPVRFQVQFELGDVPTDFALCKGPTAYETDGTGCCTVSTQGQVLTLLSDAPGLVCTYPRDTNKAYDRLVQAIISMGGNV